jgi:diguanylate cyclase (GGDEF)-like protein
MTLLIHQNQDISLPPAGRTPPGADLLSVISQLRAENASLQLEVQRLAGYESLAYRDHLTGLLNRRAFAERLDEECARVRRGPDYQFAIVVIDVDEFKSINDTYGHTTGDEVLSTIGFLLERNVRNVDLCYRIGGDEFAIILPGTDEAGCEIVIQRLAARMSIAVSTLRPMVSLSFGTAAAPPGEANTEAIVAAADEAMYRDKRRRKEARG